jgi:hypothetical protein
LRVGPFLISGKEVVMALVVKSWFSDVSPREDGCYVEVVGRESGIISWFLALLGIDPNYSLQMQYDKLFYEARSVFGYRRVVLPLASVSSLYFGYAKPWKLALFWFALFAFGAFMAADMHEWGWAGLLFLLGIIISVLIFIFNKVLTLGVSEQNGDSYTLQFKRSVIEGQEINEQSLERITQIFVAIVDAHKARSGRSA